MKVARPDQEPGFWPAYPTEPASRLQRAIQYPMHDERFASRVVNAYAADAADMRRRKASK